MNYADLPNRVIRKLGRIITAERRITPRNWLASPIYAQRFGARWHAVERAAAIERAPPVFHGSLRADLLRRLDPAFPELGVLELEQPLLYGDAGWVFGREATLLPDHSWYVGHADEMKIPARLPAGERLAGVCLSLATDFGVGSFGHFMLDVLPRLALFRRAGYSLGDVDHLFLPKPPKSAQRLFDQLGVPRDKCVWADGNVALRPDVLLAPSFPGTRRNYPAWVPDFLRAEFLPAGGAPPQRRLYVSRAGYKRRAVDESAVEQLLASHGFEIYNPIRHADPPTDFSEAAIVVGAQGSAMSTIAFCRPGTRVLELMPTDHAQPYHYSLAHAGGLDYGAFVCRSVTERAPDAFGPSDADYLVDLHELEQALRRVTTA
jgi:capsular polysaccharide biosynthesis protein